MDGRADIYPYHVCDVGSLVGVIQFSRILKLLKEDLYNYMYICDPLCEIQAKVSKSNYEITSIKV